MGLISWIVLGGLAGWIASMFAKTNESMGVFANIAAGVVGAMVGGFVFGLFGGEGVNGFNLYSLVVAAVGAFLLISVIKAFRK